MFTSSSKFLPFYIIFIVLGVFERITSTFFHKEIKGSRKIYYKWTFFVPLYSYLFIIILSIAEYFFIVKIINIIISVLGFLIFATGALLRRKSIVDLGKNWSLYIEIEPNHKLITNGIYKFLKHPYCLAVFLELIGACLVANTFYSLIPVFLIQVPLLVVRITLEERVLISYFGDAYKKYIIGKII